jgi:hypothetical protein
MMVATDPSGERPIGYALRVLYRRGRRFDDYVVTQWDPEDMSAVGAPPGGEVRVLSQTPIVMSSMTGPVLVVDRIVPAAFENPQEWVDRALTGLLLGVRSADREPMGDEEFWEFISLLGGTVNDDGLGLLLDALMELDVVRLSAFRDALWAKLHALDHPENTIRSRDGVVSDDASLYYRCEIVAAGQDAYDAAITRPHPGGGDDGTVGEGLLTVAEDASENGLMVPLTVIETGRNPAHWPGVLPPQDPWLEIPSPGPFSAHCILSSQMPEQKRAHHASSEVVVKLFRGVGWVLFILVRGFALWILVPFASLSWLLVHSWAQRASIGQSICWYDSNFNGILLNVPFRPLRPPERDGRLLRFREMAKVKTYKINFGLEFM